jgi:SAM-dependent methyltransferase
MPAAYDRSFFAKQMDGSRASASVVLRLVADLVPVGSVCDVGCGVGTWLNVWQELGVTDIYGIDGDYVDRAHLLIDADHFHPRDLTQSVRIERTFDLAMCMEVAEHLPPERAESLVADLMRLAPIVLFSAAVPMQGGTNHINEQWQDYWAGLFDRGGFEVFDVIRPRLWGDERIARWYRQNALIYCNRDCMARFPQLAAAAAKFPLSLVHPRQLLASQQEVDTRTALRITAGALKRALARRLSRVAKAGSKSGEMSARLAPPR